MSVAIPASRPKLSRAEVEKIIDHYGVDRNTYKVIIVGIRGYYEDSIGKPKQNDRGVYDDAIFIVTPKYFGAFNANTDPSTYRKGYGFGDQKGIATLKAGAYYAWKIDLHKGKYTALCQRLGKMTVIRDGNPPYEQTHAYLGINNHKGGITTTASLGCQTVPPSQWDEYMAKVLSVMMEYYGLKYKDTVVPYCLLKNQCAGSYDKSNSRKA